MTAQGALTTARAKAKGVRRRARNVVLAAQGKPVPLPAQRTATSADPNPLRTYFDNYEGREVHKWFHYFPIYHRHLAPYRDKPVTIVEFGINHGGSLRMWRDYFGKQARIVGVDINPLCADFADGNAEVVIGDQEDRDFLQELAESLGGVDVVIEDGGHFMAQQINTFEVFWPHISDGGVFLMEDLHTSYWEYYGGGYRKPGTFIEYAKDLVDQQHAWHSKTPDLAVDDLTRSIRGMHVYDSIIVFDKDRVPKPGHKRQGYRSA